VRIIKLLYIDIMKIDKNTYYDIKNNGLLINIGQICTLDLKNNGKNDIGPTFILN